MPCLKHTTTTFIIGVALLVWCGPWSAGPAWARERRWGRRPAGAPAQSIEIDGRSRTYLLHLPPQRLRNRPLPLVIALHGGHGSGQRMVELTQQGLNVLADREGFIAVYPDGVDKHWNDGRAFAQYRTQREGVDDVGFIRALIDRLVQQYGADPRRVYVTGMSNGALMSNRLACELADKIAAAAPVCGALATNLLATCHPTRPISMAIFNGTQDPLVPWDAEEVYAHLGLRRQPLGKRLTVPDTVAHWVRHNGCPSRPVVTQEPDRDPADGTRVRKETYGPCRGGTEVIVYAVEGGGHTWAGGWQYLGERHIGKTSQDLDANEVIWEFFKRHPMR
ncbi:MAG: phospholipase [Candidatus Omnitrophica bacterium]|nr:phospholipase [Candidatus Omnitrophota bacterium]